MLSTCLALWMSTATAATPLSLNATDGTRIHAEATLVKGTTRGVVMAHMVGRDSGDWASLAKRLESAKLSSIAVDLRGHGKSAKAGDELTADDYTAMVTDLAAAVRWLRSKGATDVSCVGASLGANLCAQLSAADPGIVNLVLLSPGLNYKGVTSGGALKAYGDRPVLIVAADDDRFGPRNAVYGVCSRQIFKLDCDDCLRLLLVRNLFTRSRSAFASEKYSADVESR